MVGVKGRSGRPLGPAHSHRGPYNECWVWTGFLLKGYGRVWWEERLQLVHRLVYEVLVGHIPEGLLVLHHCDNPPCYNPAHLYVGTNQDNANDRVVRGRSSHKTYERTNDHRIKMSEVRKGKKSFINGQEMVGDNHPRTKLSSHQIDEIRQSHLSRAELAKQYNVSWTQINRIIKGLSR